MVMTSSIKFIRTPIFSSFSFIKKVKNIKSRCKEYLKLLKKA